MKIDFDKLPEIEASAEVGFSTNRLIRDSENRDEQTLKTALSDPALRAYFFSGNKVLVRKGEEPSASFPLDVAGQFDPQMEAAVLLGHDGNGPLIAVPVGHNPDTLEEPWKAYDLRSLLYSSSVDEADAGAIAQAGSLLHWHDTNRFCGKCGSQTRSAIGGYRRECPNCGFNSFPRTDPVVIMLAVCEDKCLLGRSPHFPEGWYSTLAGFVEPGETIEDAVRRETFEESGIRIGKVAYHASQPWPFPHSLMIGVHCEAISEEITMDESELEDCRWFSREDVVLMISEEHPQGYRCPPNKAISSALIGFWALD